MLQTGSTQSYPEGTTDTSTTHALSSAAAGKNSLKNISISMCTGLLLFLY